MLTRFVSFLYSLIYVTYVCRYVFGVYHLQWSSASEKKDVLNPLACTVDQRLASPDQAVSPAVYE
jgi:hypothetical protein